MSQNHARERSTRQFHRAVDIVQSLPKTGRIQSSYTDKLVIYGLFKQATEGDRPNMRPSMFDVLGRAKWDAWDKQKGLSKQQAMANYVQVLQRLLEKYPDVLDTQKYIDELDSFSREGPGAHPKRVRRSSSASSSSNDSFMSSRQSAGVVHQPDNNPQVPPVPQLSTTEPFLAVCPAKPEVGGSSTTVPTGVHNPLQYNPLQNPPPTYLNNVVPRSRHRSGSDSSISLGGDAQTHRPSRPPSNPNPRRGPTADPALDFWGERMPQHLHHRGNSRSSTQRPGPGSQPWPAPYFEPQVELYNQNNLPYQHPFVHLHTMRASTPQNPLRPAFSPTPMDHWRSPQTFTPFGVKQAVSQAPQQYLAQPQWNAQSGIIPASQSVQPQTSGAADVPLVLERIQTSLTALHERISSIEHTQSLVLRQPADPWTVLLRMFTGGNPPTLQRNRWDVRTERAGLVSRVMWRLIGTIRRTMIDASFVLVLMSLVVAIMAGIKGKGRGGRRALLQFWFTVMTRCKAAGRSLKGDIAMA